VIYLLTYVPGAHTGCTHHSNILLATNEDVSWRTHTILTTNWNSAGCLGADCPGATACPPKCPKVTTSPAFKYCFPFTYSNKVTAHKFLYNEKHTEFLVKDKNLNFHEMHCNDFILHSGVKSRGSDQNRGHCTLALASPNADSSFSSSNLQVYDFYFFHSFLSSAVLLSATYFPFIRLFSMCILFLPHAALPLILQCKKPRQWSLLATILFPVTVDRTNQATKHLQLP